MVEQKTTSRTQFRVLLNESLFLLRGELKKPFENGFEEKNFKNGISNIDSLRADFFTPDGLNVSIDVRRQTQDKYSGKRIVDGQLFGINFNRIRGSRWGYTLWHLPKVAS